VFEKALVEDNVKNFTRKGEQERIPPDEMDLDRLSLRKGLDNRERSRGVIELEDLCPVSDESKTIAPRPGTNFQDPLALQVDNSQQIPQDPVGIRIDLVNILLRSPEPLPVYLRRPPQRSSSN